MSEAVMLPVETESSPADAPAPPARNPRICPNCGNEFFAPVKGPGQGKRYCSNECRCDWGNREKALGAVILTTARIWAQNRGSGKRHEISKVAFARMAEALDLMNDREAKAG